ncbi:MAG: DNA-directed RNA polymerase subunit omega [candidate division Zixibacteria bacterium]|nr:DNA-directed RNA polymerase subunit omega [candidate division Zixibacteria bacterium]
MNFNNLEKAVQSAGTRYEAVIRAAKAARWLNRARKKYEEGGAPMKEELPSHRVTEAALEELVSGHVEFERL